MGNLLFIQPEKGFLSTVFGQCLRTGLATYGWQQPAMVYFASKMENLPLLQPEMVFRMTSCWWFMKIEKGISGLEQMADSIGTEMENLEPTPAKMASLMIPRSRSWKMEKEISG